MNPEKSYVVIQVPDLDSELTQQLLIKLRKELGDVEIGTKVIPGVKYAAVEAYPSSSSRLYSVKTGEDVAGIGLLNAAAQVVYRMTENQN